MILSTGAKVLLAPLLVLTVVGCSREPGPPHLKPGELAAGTAEVSIDGRPSVTSDSVKCSPAGAQTAIVTGGGETGTAATIDTVDGLVPLFVELTDVNGFTGSYWRGFGDEEPDVMLTGRTYLIEGTATGYGRDDPAQRVARAFSIRVAC